MSKAKKQKTEPPSQAGPTQEKVQTVKGGIPLDVYISEHLQASHHVLRVGDEVWDAMLNMSNCTENNNKYYIIQLLEHDLDQDSAYYVWNRWGRVGRIFRIRVCFQKISITAFVLTF